MRTFITYVSGIVFAIGLFLLLGTPDFIGIPELIRQMGIAFGLMVTGLVGLGIGGKVW